MSGGLKLSPSLTENLGTSMVSERRPVQYMEGREHRGSSRVDDLFSSFHCDKDEGIIPGARSPESMQVAFWLGRNRMQVRRYPLLVLLHKRRSNRGMGEHLMSVNCNITMNWKT